MFVFVQFGWTGYLLSYWGDFWGRNYRCVFFSVWAHLFGVFLSNQHLLWILFVRLVWSWLYCVNEEYLSVILVLLWLIHLGSVELCYVVWFVDLITFFVDLIPFQFLNVEWWEFHHLISYGIMNSHKLFTWDRPNYSSSPKGLELP